MKYTLIIALLLSAIFSEAQIHADTSIKSISINATMGVRIKGKLDVKTIKFLFVFDNSLVVMGTQGDYSLRQIEETDIRGKDQMVFVFTDNTWIKGSELEILTVRKPGIQKYVPEKDNQ